jgi:hypothetical protein
MILARLCRPKSGIITRLPNFPIDGNLMMKGQNMDWFRHDSNANLDDKLQEVLLDYGLEGYGLYWYCIELIVGRVAADNITFELKHDARVIARNTGSTPQKVEEMMKRFVDVGLFENFDGTITCLKVAKRLMTSATSNPQMRNLIQNIKENQGVETPSRHRHDDIMPDKIRLDKIREEKKTKYTPQIPAELLADYLKLRKAKKAGELTETAFKGIEREALKAGITAERAIQICCERGWVGFKAEWIESKPKSYQDSREAAARTAFGSLLTNQFQIEKVIGDE